MQDLMSMLHALRRPRLLIRAARAGAQDYRRERCLPRLMGGAVPTRTGAIMMQLMAQEAELNDQRLARDASYNLPRHIDVLMALMGEARLLAQTRTAEIIPLPRKSPGDKA